MGYLLCDEVGPGLRESEAGVTVRDITGRPQRLRVERDFLREANQRYYLPIGIVARDPAAPRVLIEFPHEADSGANRIWVAPGQLLDDKEQPQQNAAAPDRLLGLMADEPELIDHDRRDDRAALSSADKGDESRPEQNRGTAQLPAVWGLMADEPELVDRIVADIYKTRATQPLRQPTSE